MKPPHGGITYIADLFECEGKTVSRGITELKKPELIEKGGVRKKGGGRKTSLVTIPYIDKKFITVIRDHTAGDPMDENIRCTHLTHQLIAN